MCSLWYPEQQAALGNSHPQALTPPPPSLPPALPAQVAIESAKTFEGAPVRDAGMDPEDTPIGAADGEGGATFEVVLAHPDVLAKRGYPQHMLAIIGNSAYANEVGANQCVLETAPKGVTPGGAAGRTSFAAGLAAVAAAALAGLAAPLLL